MFLIGSLVLFSPLILIYLWLVNRAILRVPKEIEKISPHRWTKKQMKETYERIEKNPIDFAPHLPPKLDRRYIVVGGSGMSKVPNNI